MKETSFTFEEGKAIESVAGFLDEIRAFAGTEALELYFRGEPQESRQLMPSIGRRQFHAGRSITFNSTQERQMLRRFRRHAYAHFQRVPSEWETLFLARHHGLPTRLLDWTANPLVSLYFAAFHENNDLTYRGEDESAATMKLNLDGTVWAIQRRTSHDEDLDVFDPSISPLDIDGIRVVQPFHPTPRIAAQSSVFTLHGDPWVDVVACAGRNYDAAELDIKRLKRWRVTSECKAGVITDLEQLAVNSRTLFPDLDGLAKGLWQTEIIRAAVKQ